MLEKKFICKRFKHRILSLGKGSTQARLEREKKDFSWWGEGVLFQPKRKMPAEKGEGGVTLLNTATDTPLERPFFFCPGCSRAVGDGGKRIVDHQYGDDVPRQGLARMKGGRFTG